MPTFKHLTVIITWFPYPINRYIPRHRILLYSCVLFSQFIKIWTVSKALAQAIPPEARSSNIALI